MNFILYIKTYNDKKPNYTNLSRYIYFYFNQTLG